MREILVTAVSAILLTPAVLLSISIGTAQVMESGSYRIQSDSVNFGGGTSTSTNYSLESTAGEVATGDSDSTSYSMRAGYQQMLGSYISISGFEAVNMTPSIPGVSGGYANGSTTVTVVTDNAAGYVLQVSSETSPAMQKGADTIADYEPLGVDPDFTFTIAATDAYFGYTPEGIDITDRFRDNGAVCNLGTDDAELSCWDGLSTTPTTVSQGTSGNHPIGATTTINLRVGVGGAVIQSPGFYTATTTLTALTL
jgi:hypothetical protein